jgi:ubiquinol-cytochrome c reductase cytochrome b subunit
MQLGHGVELGAPANPAEDPGTARPEWSFRGLYQFRELFPARLEIVPIFAVSGLVVLLFFAMPLVGSCRFGHALNILLTVVVLAGLAVLSWQSYAADAKNASYVRALAAGRQESMRVKQLARLQGIPAGGALALLADDPKTQGPKLFQQHCAVCHDYSSGMTPSDRKTPPTAPNLYRYASRAWIRGLLDPKQISGPRYFGNTKFKKGKMPVFVKETLEDADPEDIDNIVAALSAEAGLRSQRGVDGRQAGKIAKGQETIARDCVDCHTFHGKGGHDGPLLTGYATRRWLMEIITDPTAPHLYGKENDRMPTAAQSMLSEHEVGLLADWLRGEWLEE